MQILSVLALFALASFSSVKALPQDCVSQGTCAQVSSGSSNDNTVSPPFSNPNSYNPNSYNPNLYCTNISPSSTMTFNIQHSSGNSCLHPSGGIAYPNTPVVFYNLCDNESRILYQYNNGTIMNTRSGLCFQPGSSTISNNDPVVFGNCDTSAAQFTWLSNGAIQHTESQMCLHPLGGSNNPSDGTQLVFYNQCDSGKRIEYCELLQTPASS